MRRELELARLGMLATLRSMRSSGYLLSRLVYGKLRALLGIDIGFAKK